MSNSASRRTGALYLAELCAARTLFLSAFAALAFANVTSAQSLPSMFETAVTQVAGGNVHTCALTVTGSVQCWGSNSNGQLGDGSTITRATPVNVSGLASGVVQIAAGALHTCALTTAGGVQCWGNNGNGQLGDGGTINSLTPVAVSGLTSGVAQITAGIQHTCALTTAGGVQCWGYNDAGQLGDGTTTRRLTPVAVNGLASGAVQLAAGWNHACALSTAGGVQCWGNNVNGQLGDGSGTNRLTPTAVSGLTSGIAQISTGGLHTCALTTTGGAQCWGYNGYGELGDSSTIDSQTPVAVSGLASGVAQISAGSFHTCALTTAGGAQCWGYNGSGHLGDGSTTSRPTPTAVSGLATGAAQIVAANYQTCALTTAGGAQCWGDNTFGQVGDGSTTNRFTPVPVVGLASGVAQIVAGISHTCALSASGGVKCWGYNDSGQLGDGSLSNRTTPVAVSGLASGVVQLAAGGYHTCAVTSAGGVQCWGRNISGQLGDNSNTNRATPVAVNGLASGVAQITAGALHTCALTTTGGVQCWGYNDRGQLGVSGVDRWTPVAVSGLASGVAQITAGSYHTCALTTGGGIQCWGRNIEGQLGDNGTTDRATPGAVSGLASGMAQVEASGYHTCARSTGGGVQCWGDNFYGQIGDGSTTTRLTPVAVTGLASGVAEIAAGGRHNCVRTTAGAAQCWGRNLEGQLGDNSTTNRPTPVAVSGLASGVAQLTAGLSHTCLRNTIGAIQCWGSNVNGQIGDGTTIERRTPMRVRFGQSISFAPPASVIVATPLSLTATSSSGLTTPTFDTWTPGTCSVTTGGTVTATNTALCGIRVSQAGSNTYAPASQKLVLLQVRAKFTIATAANPVAGGSVTCTPNPVVQDDTANCTQTPNAGYTFTGWSGDCSGTSACSLVNVTAARSVIANYTLNTYAITVAASPMAGGTASCTPNPVDHGSNASCTQTANTGYTFSGWSGDCTGTGACSLNNVTAAKTVTANFTLNSYAITTAANPVAGGTVTCTPNPVIHGTNATCMQTPNAGYVFTGWSGDCAGTGACNLVAVAAAKTVTANYLHEPTLNIDGSVTSTYNAGTDGVLLLRYLLGVRGAALTNGALGGDAQRNAAQIEAHIASNLMLFDVDGDGNVTALTDGLLILRRLLGLSGTALVDGARNGSRSATDIANAIDLLRP